VAKKTGVGRLWQGSAVAAAAAASASAPVAPVGGSEDTFSQD